MLLLGFVVVLSLTQLPAASAEPEGEYLSSETDEFTRVAEYLRDAVDGRTVHRPKRTITIANGTVESEASVMFAFKGFLLGEDHLQYYSTMYVEQTLWDLDESGKRLPGTERNKSRTWTSHYGLRRLKSTIEERGVSTSPQAPGYASALHALPW